MAKRTSLLVVIAGLGAAFLAFRAKKPVENLNRLDTELVRKSQRYNDEVQAEINAIWLRIENFIESRHPGYLATLPPPATDEEILHLEDTIGYRLPGDFKASLKRHAEWITFFSDYSLRSISDIEASWTVQAEFMGVYPSVARLDCVWKPGLIPFASYDVQEICIDLESGTIRILDDSIQWSNAEAPSFRVWLKTVADRLEAGEHAHRESRGKPVYDLLGEFGAFSSEGLMTPGSTVVRKPKN